MFKEKLEKLKFRENAEPNSYDPSEIASLEAYHEKLRRLNTVAREMSEYGVKPSKRRIDLERQLNAQKDLSLFQSFYAGLILNLF